MEIRGWRQRRRLSILPLSIYIQTHALLSRPAFHPLPIRAARRLTRSFLGSAALLPLAWSCLGRLRPCLFVSFRMRKLTLVGRATHHFENHRFPIVKLNFLTEIVLFLGACLNAPRRVGTAAPSHRPGFSMVLGGRRQWRALGASAQRSSDQPSSTTSIRLNLLITSHINSDQRRSAHINSTQLRSTRVNSGQLKPN